MAAFFSQVDIALWATLAVGLIIVAATSLGSGLLSRSDLLRDQPWLRYGLCLGVGYNALAWIGLGLSELGLGGTPAALVLLILLAGAGSQRWVTRLLERRRSGKLLPPQVATSHWAFAILVMLALGPAYCLPEAWDELVYHAELPKRWLAVGRLTCDLDLPYSAFPSLVEIVSWLVAPIEFSLAPRLQCATLWLVAQALIYANLRLYVAQGLAMLLTIAFACSDTLLLVAGGGYVEPALMMNSALLWLLLGKYAGTDQFTRRGSLAVLGLLAAGCGAVKLTGLAMWPVPVLLLCFSTRPHRLVMPPLKSLMWYVFSSMLFLLPFYGRAWLATGNPIFPFYDTWFSQDPNRVISSQFHHAIGGEGFGFQSGWQKGHSPWALEFYLSGFDGSFGLQSLVLWLWCVVRMATLLRAGRLPLAIGGMALCVLWLWIFWLGTSQQARFAIPAAMGSWVLATSLLTGMSRRFQLAGGGLLLGLAVISAPWPATNYYLAAWMAQLRLVDKLALVDEATGYDYIPLVVAVEELTPPDSRIMLVCEHRGFYIPREAVIGTPFFQSAGFTPLKDYRSVCRVLEVLQRSEIDYLIVASRPMGPDCPAAWMARTEELIRGLHAAAESGGLELVWQSPSHQLFKVSAVLSQQPAPPDR